MASEVTPRRRQTPTQARAARRERRNRRNRLKRILALVAVGGVSGLFLIALFIPQSFGGGSDRSIPDGPGVRLEDQGREHIPEGGSHAPYNASPPTSGWHYDRWASWGIKTEPLPPELYIHNMEHGGVILHYNCPDGCPDEVAQMEEIVQRTDETILMPNPNIESRFALTAWNWVLTMDEYDDGQARDFVRSHLNSPNAPEWISR